MIEQYEHHGVKVWVNSEFKGKHREMCLCFKCSRFSFDKNINCPIANLLFAACVKFNLVTPVLECAEFDESKDASE